MSYIRRMIHFLKEKKYKAFIFDMDGTVIDSTFADFTAWNRVLSDYGKPAIRYEEYVTKLGIKAALLIKDHFDIPLRELDNAVRKKHDYFVEYIDANGLHPIENAIEFILQLKSEGFKVALATGARYDKIKIVFQRMEIQHLFDAVIAAEDVLFAKPDPEVFLKAAKKINISPAECIVVEDAQNGVLAAKSAGMYCIAITTTTPAEKLKNADKIITAYKEIF